MKETRLRLPALLFGLLLSALFCALTPFNNVKLQNSPLAGGHFPLASFGCLLLILTLVNPLLSRLRKAWKFHLHELLLIWSMVTTATGIAYTGLLRTFIINLTTPVWFTSVAGSQEDTLLPLLPSMVFPQDPNMVKSLYSGLEGGLDMKWTEILVRIPWSVWITPMALWGVFILFTYTAMIGLAGLFSHQWVENEKMNFPLLRVPEILSKEAEKKSLGKYFSHQYFLIGLSIPVFLHLFNGLHTYFPQVPQIPTLILAQPYIPKEGILSGFYKAKIYIYPAFIGFAFLASKQISFSFWLFFLLGGFLPGTLQALGWRIPAAALGTTFSPVLSRVEEMQMVGAFGVFFFFIVWLARDYLFQVARSMWTGKDPVEDAHGFLTPRASVWALLAGFFGIVLWLGFMGMNVLAALIFIGVCFMFQLVASRLICQGGLPYFTLALAPSDGFLAFLNTRLISPVTLYLALIVQKVTFLDLRESLMPSLFHSSKLSDGSRPANRFLWGIVLALIVGVTVSFVSMLALYYKYGISTLPDDWAIDTARRVHENAAQVLNHPEGSKEWSMLFTSIGALVMLLLVMGYHQFIWWPLHPIGYLTTYSSAMQILWFGFFIGWLCNTIVLRYGGVHLFKEVRRLFVGMIVGDLVMAIIWLIVGMFNPISYHVLPL